MPAGLQVWDSNSVLTFDSTVHRLLRYTGEYNMSWSLDSTIWSNGSYQRVKYKGTVDLGYLYSINNTIAVINSNNSGQGSSVTYGDNCIFVETTTTPGSDPSSSFNPVKIMRF